MLMLFIDEQLLLFIADEPHVDQNLSNAAMSHDEDRRKRVVKKEKE
jgi:hypothetical protein